MYKNHSIFLLLLILILCSNINAQTFRLKRPVPENIQLFGSYLYGEERFWDENNAHRGVDIWVNYDTVYSASNGTIEFVGYDSNNTTGGYEPNGFGNYLRIKSRWNEKDIFIYYAHLTKPLKKNGDEVVEGEPIAVSGNTGNSTGPHLHFEIREETSYWKAEKNRRNPELWFAKEGMGAIYGRVPNATDNTKINITPDPKPRPPYTTFEWGETYKFADPTISGDDIYNENYAIGDVKPGTYTITALNGTYKRIVTVEAGKVVNADEVTSVENNNNNVKQFVLFQNYPNPFNPTTIIKYSIPLVETLHATSLQEQLVQLKIYDVLGKNVATLVNQIQEPGNYQLEWNAKKQSSGIYFYRLHVGDFVETKTMLLVK
ncbi:MAG: peptidoglycan DD-metalloendopeptidase family protein [Melioribacteraceae bacterium]